MPQITLSSNDRLFICGKTGSGKTYLARYLTKSLKRLVVLDGKGTLGIPEWRLSEWSENVDLKDPKAEYRLRAVPPLKTELAEFWDTVLMACLRAGNITVYIDELYAVCPPNRNPTPTLFACYTRGREFGLGMWASTQRPVWIPLVSMSEAEHFFMFRLQLLEDKQRLAAFMGKEIIEPIQDEHGFYYMRAIDDVVTYYEKFNPVASAEVEKETIAPDKMLQQEQPRKRRIHLIRSL